MTESLRISSIDLAQFSESRDRRPTERIPLTTIIPRAWIGFSQAPWRFVGLTALMLITVTGLSLISKDLQQGEGWWQSALSDVLFVATIPTTLLPIVALLHLADQLLPSIQSTAQNEPVQERQRLRWIFRQTTSLVLLEGVILIGGLNMIRIIGALIARQSGVISTVVLLAGGLVLILWTLSQTLALPLLVHHGHRPLAAMEHSRRLVQNNRLKVLALLGLLIGVNLIGLMGAFIGLLLSIPFSALLLMASCRTQTPWVKDSRRNMLPT
ncbi:hypothetical protein [Synechococcus sp. BIOS-E4-1]|uniref:hypothetical protein n=1 Tax=Synechococcus sp. BIOS-E4-1 TaxID=1400864 RepID=UPI00210528F1|nr:hypothetical protein [Synechococcus sp. BIOS-E4-1]